MKYNKVCPKCNGNEIVEIEGGSFKGNIYNTISYNMTAIYLTRYVCLQCGFSENYVCEPDDIEKLRKKYFKEGTKDSDFV